MTVPDAIPGVTVWITGLPGAGKTTLGEACERMLRQRGARVRRIDGDSLRRGDRHPLGFTAGARHEQARRACERAEAVAGGGGTALVSLVSPYRDDRDLARGRHEALGLRFLEVYLATPLDTCEARDHKGIYRKARAGRIRRFTGIDDPYEPPAEPDLTLSSLGSTPEDNAETIVGLLLGSGVGVRRQ